MLELSRTRTIKMWFIKNHVIFGKYILIECVKAVVVDFGREGAGLRKLTWLANLVLTCHGFSPPRTRLPIKSLGRSSGHPTFGAQFLATSPRRLRR